MHEVKAQWKGHVKS